ncbi:hypothetical protein [Kibdelosporangium philippinense]
MRVTNYGFEPYPQPPDLHSYGIYGGYGRGRQTQVSPVTLPCRVQSG